MTITMSPPLSPMSARLGSSVAHQRVWDLGYELLELSASGTFCDVWRVRHRQTYELFLWKQLRAEWDHDPAARATLENEAAVGQLARSPLLLKLIEAHLAERPRYVIWECFEGRTVEQLWQEYHPLPIRNALWIARQCAQGLDDLLHAGLLHGDLRANGVLVNVRTGLVKLTDLGSSRRAPTAMSSATPSDKRRPHVQAGPMGDYDSFVSPPLLEGVARDLHQLGIILFRSLAGRMPFAGETAADMLRGRQANVADDLRRVRPDLTPAIAKVVSDLLAEPDQQHLSHPATVAHRLMELEVHELLTLT